MSGVANGRSDTGVVLLSREGTVLARSGPPALVGEAARVGYANLPGMYRGDHGEDLLALLTEVAEAPKPTPRSVLVRSTDASSPGVLRLTLHPVASGLVVGVLASESAALGETREAIDALDLVWDGLTEGMAIASGTDAPEGPTILAANQAFSTLFGVTRGEGHLRPLVSFLAPVSGEALLARIRADVIGEGKAISDLTLVKTASGDGRAVAWEVAPVRSRDGRAVDLVVFARDVTLGSERDPRRRGTDVDPLSGLPNKAHLLNRLERSVELAAQARQYAFGVVGIEMRGLRAVERRLGTLVANTVLEALVRRVELRLRPGDLVARTGERRLSILLDHVAPSAKLDAVLERIRAVTVEPYTIAGARITMSPIGTVGPVWSSEHPPRDAQYVLDGLDGEARHAMDRGASGEARRGSADAREPATADLAKAVSRGQLDLVYLPLMSLESGRLMGLEALVRWVHPERGIIAGHDFLEDAEQEGLIEDIGRWVLRRVCEQAKEWETALGAEVVPPIHVNISAREFWNHELVAHVRKLTEELALDSARIRLEVPEAAVARRVESACRILAGMKEAGIEPWLDHFGEGGIRLRDLPALPVRHVKLARALSWEGAGVPTPLLKSLLSIGHDLGWEASVAGVETRPQQETLLHAACDLAQGFYYSEPLDPSGAAALARQSALDKGSSTLH